MKVTLVMVSSADGLITRGDEVRIYDWTSPEDQDHFQAQVATASLIVMGRATFEAARPVMKLMPGKLRVVLTRSPAQYQPLAVPDQLEFSSETPTALVARLEAQGYRELLLVGGSEINFAFGAAGLINAIWLTVEPVIHGRGQRLFSASLPALKLQLQTSQRLNRSGTLLLHYTLAYD